MMITVWITLIMASHQAVSNVIIVNNDGQNSTECCVVGQCHCSSLFNALQSINTSTTINITSESVKIHNYTSVNDTNNILITGSNVIVCCNNTGTLICLL